MRQDFHPSAYDGLEASDLLAFGSLGPQTMLTALQSRIVVWPKLAEAIAAGVYPQASPYLMLICSIPHIVDRKFDIIDALEDDLHTGIAPGPDFWMCLARIVVDSFGDTERVLHEIQEILSAAHYQDVHKYPVWLQPFGAHGDGQITSGQSIAQSDTSAIRKILDEHGIPQWSRDS